MQQIQFNNDRLITADGIELFYRSWCPPEPVGVIALIHGLADHSGRFTETAEYFATHGWAIYACDLRGHGLSADGLKQGRVHVNDFDDYARDVDAILSLAKEANPGLPAVLLGHSMGGLISLRYTIAHPEKMDGVVISSPVLGVPLHSAPPAWQDLVVRVLSKLWPRKLFPSNLDANAVSSDPEVVKAYIDDPLVSDMVSARWYTSISGAVADMEGRALQLSVPTLLMQSGADTLVDPQASRVWADKAPAEIIEFVVWDGLFHEMFNEPEKEMVRERVLEWLQKI
jgi:alpha-beta hydrolase superfamily lysophospholipase